MEAVRDDLETLVLDADVLEELLGDPDRDAKAKEIEIKIAPRLRRARRRPALRRPRRAAGGPATNGTSRACCVSLDFLKQLLELAKDVVEAEQEVAARGASEDRGKAALTELFESVQNGDTPIIVERVVDDIDEIVRQVRFPGWQHTDAGEREVKQALRRTLLQVQAPHGPGPVRPGVRLHQAVLLTSFVPDGHDGDRTDTGHTANPIGRE